MKFPWWKYEEKVLERRNTLQVFITNKCNLGCDGCFARNVMAEAPNKHMSIKEYTGIVKDFLRKGGGQINLLGGEPLLHPELRHILLINNDFDIKTTIYTNGKLLHKFTNAFFLGAKLRVSIYTLDCIEAFYDEEDLAEGKGAESLISDGVKFDANFMISNDTSVSELVDTANYVQKWHKCNVFFMFSELELNNEHGEFFCNVNGGIDALEYKKLVHGFLEEYEGDMDIHISKRGVFESTTTLPDHECHFANKFIGGKVIQCPFDVVNLKYDASDDYEFGDRYCQHNNTCLMSKIILTRRK